MTQSMNLPDANDKQFEKFIQLIQNNDLPNVKDFLQHYNNNVLSRLEINFRQPALYFAVTSLSDSNAVQMVNFLISNGANPKHTDQNDQTVLFYACRDGKLETCKLFFENGLSIEEQDMYGQTPLFYAASQNRLNIVPLFDNKNIINHTDKLAHQSALYYAARKGHTQMCRQLINRGANPLILDSQNKTAADYAKKAKHSETAQFLNQQIRRLKQPIVSQHSNDLSNRQESYQINQKKTKKQNNSQISVPRATYKIVFMNQKGQAKDLTQQQVRALVKNNHQLQTYLTNPASIPIEELEKIQIAETWQKCASKVLQIITKQKGAFWFSQPVDPVKFGIMDYFDIIEKPMDLSTIKKKLTHNVYLNANHFTEDMKLIWNNCYKYNGQNHQISKTAKQLQILFNEQVKKLGLQKYLTAE